MRSIAYVTGTRDGTTEVVLGRHLECKQCGGCAVVSGSKERRLRASNEIGARVGQKVEIEMDPRHAVGAAFVMFVLPVIAALALGYTGSYLAAAFGWPRDVMGIGLGAVGFVCSFLILRYIERSSRLRLPRIVRLVSEHQPPEGGC
jgi:sigma-E factor negative regulatory protein RseC